MPHRSVTNSMFWLSLAAAVFIGLSATPLDDYVNKPDPYYEYRDLGNSYRGDGYTTYFINMTSQKWLNESLVSQSIWWHYLVVTIPDKIEFPEHALLYMTGGDNTDGIPSVTSVDCLFSVIMAFTTGSVAATLFQIPNQPIYFSEDKEHKRRTEDAIIAFTWWHYFHHSDQPEYLARLPMTKAGVRALDTIADFAGKKTSGQAKIDKFVVAGASKRGWTTWTLGAVDKRVVGIVPIVMDLLNLIPNLHHFYRALGGWTFAFNDYYQLNVTGYLDDPPMKDMANIVDPYVYIDRLTMPKFLICTGGDEFFNNDDSFYYWNDLKGPKYIRTLPNAEHSCTGHFASLLADGRSFYYSILLNEEMPTVSWTVNRTVDGGTILFYTKTKPSSVVMWHATTLDGKRRDFRLLTGPNPSKPTPHPVVWFSEDVKQIDDNTYLASKSIPEIGWTAFFIQATFAGPRATVFEVTTQVNIVPNTFPFPDCHGSGCRGTLV